MTEGDKHTSLLETVLMLYNVRGIRINLGQAISLVYKYSTRMAVTNTLAYYEIVLKK